MRSSDDSRGRLGLRIAASSENETATLKIISRAVAPGERNSGNTVALDESFNGEAQRLVERWEQLVRLKAGGDRRAFDRRLGDLGLSQSSAGRWLLPGLIDPSVPLPQWALFARAVLQPQREPVPTSLIGEFTDIEKEFLQYDPRHDVPLFPRFLGPFVTVFLQRFRSSLAALEDLACQSAVDQIARSLLIKLSAISARTVAHEVKQRRLNGTLSGDSASARFQSFESYLASTAGRTALFDRYPVLLRLLATVTLNMLDASVEMLERFRADRSAIGGLLRDPSGTRRIRSAIAGLSDPHRMGRSVWLLEFTDGSRVIYKPRSVAIDAAYAHFLDWLNSRQELLTLRCARVVAREGYGWCEFIRAEECRDEGEVARYFRRQGMHVAIFHFLCGNDLHEGNFIAAGASPVPIDLEGLLTAKEHVPPRATRDLLSQLWPITTTVALTSLLPRWYAGIDGALPYSISGIDGPTDRYWPMRKPFWRDIGTDRMRLTFEFFGETSDRGNRPRLSGASVGVEPYLDDVLRGFRETYMTILRCREELLQNGDILDGFRSAPNRTIFRDTSEYSYLLFWATSPDLLTSGAAHEVALEMLGTGDRDPAVVESEKRCLWRRDVPIFTGLPDSLELRIEEHVFPSGLESPAFEQMAERIRSASTEQLEWQAGIVQMSFRMALGHPSERLAATSIKIPQRDSNAAPGTSSRSSDDGDRLMKHAIAFGDALEALAIKNRLGCSWLSLYRPHPASPGLELMHPNPWMTTGAAGTALFLARLAKVSNENRYADLAKSALGFAFGSFELCRKHFIDNDLMQTGLNGAGLVIYSLISCARTLEDPQLSNLALRAALAIPLEACRSVHNPDILNGAAGLLLAILASYRQRPDDRLLDRARNLAAGIVDCQERCSGPAGWIVPGMDRPLLGMAHGAAGIAMALWRLHQIDGDDRWIDSVRRGIDYERSFFQPQERDWPNLQSSLEAPQFMTGWCAGAPGIGLARLAVRDLLHPAIDGEIAAAIDATCRHLGTDFQHLCCGETGRIVFLEAAGRMLKRPELTAIAANSALRMIDAYEECGFWRLQQCCERSIVPGLLDGIAGIGLALLQVACPEPDSNVLVMD